MSKARRAAARDARNTVGVVRVENRIAVRGTAPADSVIEERIESAVANDPYLERYEIGVNVVDRTAYLYGTVDSYFEKGRADDTAAAVQGVKEVRNNLSVDYMDEPLVYDPYVHGDYVYEYGWYDYIPYHTFADDREIKNEIEDELFWSPFVDADQVDVRVSDGTATLSGTVDSWNEREAAVENAYEGGAVWVKNHLTVVVD